MVTTLIATRLLNKMKINEATAQEVRDEHENEEER